MKSRYMWIWTSLITIFKVVSTEEFKIRININNNTIESTAKFYAKERPSLIELQYFDIDGTVRIWTIFYKKNLQILKNILLGESDLGQPTYQYNCYILESDVLEFLPAKRLSDIKQVLLAKQYPVDLPIQGHMFDRTIPKYLWKDFIEEVNESCSDADNIYVKIESLSKFSEIVNDGEIIEEIKGKTNFHISQYPYCYNLREDWTLGCLCKSEFMIPLFACKKNKLCSKEDALEHAEYSECPINSCSQVFHLTFLVNKQSQCLTNMV